MHTHIWHSKKKINITIYNWPVTSNQVLIRSHKLSLAILSIFIIIKIIFVSTPAILFRLCMSPTDQLLLITTQSSYMCHLCLYSTNVHTNFSHSSQQCTHLQPLSKLHTCYKCVIWKVVEDGYIVVVTH